MAEAAERLVEGRGWLPPLLRTASDPGASEPDTAEGEAEDDNIYRFSAE